MWYVSASTWHKKNIFTLITATLICNYSVGKAKCGVFSFRQGSTTEPLPPSPVEIRLRKFTRSVSGWDAGKARAGTAFGAEGWQSREQFSHTTEKRHTGVVSFFLNTELKMSQTLSSVRRVRMSVCSPLHFSLFLKSLFFTSQLQLTDNIILISGGDD